MSSSRLLTLSAFAALCACARSTAQPPPAPSAMSPARAYAGKDVPVTISGAGFTPRLTQQLSGGGGLSVDAGFVVLLGSVALQGVQWLDDSTLKAVAPAALPAGDYALTVRGPWGEGALPQAFTVSGAAPARLSAAAAAPARVVVGQQFSVAVTAANRGGMRALGVQGGAAQVSGATATAAPPAGPADLAPGASRAFAWQVTPQAPGTLQLVLPLSGQDGLDLHPLSTSARASVVVVAGAHLTATAQPVPAAVSVGQQFELSVQVVNDGGAEAQQVAPQLDPGPHATVLDAPQPRTLAAGESRSFSFTLQGASSGTAAPGCTISAADSISGLPVLASANFGAVLVQRPAALRLSALALPARVSIGQPLDVSLTLTNIGEATALAAASSLSASGPATLLGGPSAADLAGGASATLLWHFQAAGSGTASFTATASAHDANSGASLSAGPLSLGPVTQEPAAALGLTVSAPAQVSVGQAFSITLAASNAGGATAVGVAPALALPQGLRADSTPAAQDLPGGATTQFVYAVHATAAGTLSIGASVSGHDLNSGLLVSASSTAPLLAQAPAALQIVSLSAPAQVSTGQAYSVSMLVQNTGGAKALQVTAQLTGATSQPSPVDLAPGASFTFQWSLQAGSAPGALSLGGSATGLDENSAATVSAVPASAPLTVQAAAALTASLAVPAALSRGQSFTATLTVQNGGDAAALQVAGSAPEHFDLTGGAHASTSSAPAAVDLPGHSGTAFLFAFVEDGSASGSLKLRATAQGFDANSGAAVASPLAATAAVPVMEPAGLVFDSLVAPAQVSLGQPFSLSVTARNPGEAALQGLTAALSLPAGLTCSSAPAVQDLPGGATAALTWACTASAPGVLQWSASASGADANSGQTASASSAGPSILAQTPAALSIASFTLPAVVSTGQSFAALLVVQNSGGADSVQAAPQAALASGSGVILAAPLPATIPAGGSATFSFTLQAGATPGTLSLSVGAVQGFDQNSGAQVSTGPAATNVATVQAAAQLSGSLTLPALLSRGQSFTAALTVQNSGDAAALAVLPMPDPAALVGASAAAATNTSPAQGAVDLPGHGSATFRWTFVESGSAAGTLQLQAAAQGIDANSGLTAAAPAATSPLAQVQEPAALVIDSLQLTPGAQLSRGQAFTARLTVRNTGQATARQVLPSPPGLALSATGGAAATTLDAAAAQDVAGGATASWSWSFVENGSGPGTLRFSAGASGLDQNSGASTSAPALQSATLAVQQPAALTGALTAPARVSRGQTFLVSLSATNTGGATARSVTPALSLSPSGAATVLSSPAALDVAGGATTLFTWQVQQAGGTESSIAFTASASGSDANSAAPITTGAALAGSAVDAPAALSVAAFSLPVAVTRGQAFTATLIVSNTGDATALHVLPTAPVVTTTGGALAATSTLQAAVDLQGHRSATFSWTFSESGSSPGTLALATSLSGSDANSGAALSASASAGPVPVQNPSQLQILTFTVPARISRGQSFTASLTVKNSGGSTVNGVGAPAPTVQASGGALADTTSSPAAVNLSPGQSTTMSWSFQEHGLSAGTLVLAAQVSGTDTVSLASVSANASSNAAVVEQAASIANVTLSLPPRLARGQAFSAVLVVKNSGGATAQATLPGALALSFTGGAHATVLSSPAAQDLTGGATGTFTWSLVEDGSASGTLSAAAGATATDANSGAALSKPAQQAGPVPVEQPAALAIVSLTAPARVTRGQSFTLGLTVRNSGEAAAVVQPAAPSITPAGAAVLSATPAAVTLPGGASTTFTWTATEAQTGAASLGVSAQVSGSDADSGALLSAGPATATTFIDTPPQLSIASFTLRSALGAAAINRGAAFSADLTVTNTGQAAALISPAPPTPALSATGGAAASTATVLTPASIAGGATRVFHWDYLEAGSAPGTLRLSAGLSGSDANSGAAVSAPALSSNVLSVQSAAALAGTLAVPASIARGDSFTAAFTVTNSGGAQALSVTPLLALTGTAGVTQLSAPSAANLPGGQGATFSWTFKATTSGTLQLTASAQGTDQNDGATRSASAQASAQLADAALLAVDPFGDGTPFSNVFAYQGRVWLGPRKDGAGAVRFFPDGSSPDDVDFAFAGDTNLQNNALSPATGPWPSLGYAGCTQSTTQCGPDNENGRGFFGAGTFNGTETLVALGARGNGGLLHGYSTTSAAVAPLPLGSFRLDAITSGEMREVASMLVAGSRVYFGFNDNKAHLVYADSLSGSPNFTDLNASQMPGVGSGNGASRKLIDSMATFNGLFYFANNGGCERSEVANPIPYGLLDPLLGLLGGSDWASCTPSSSAWTSKTSVTTTKTSGLTPADRAVPGLVAWSGKLYLARNTTAGPQLWACAPGSNGGCDPGEWSLVAPSSTGDTTLTNFNDAALTAVTLLAATAQHLYVGFDSASGVQLFRTSATAPAARADFEGLNGCSAAGHPASCPGLSGAGLGSALTRFWAAQAMTFSGKEYLYLTAGTGSAGFSVYRLMP